jgi:hypothetical protein
MDRALGPSGGNTVSSCTDTLPGEMPLVLIPMPLLFGLSNPAYAPEEVPRVD